MDNQPKLPGRTANPEGTRFKAPMHEKPPATTQGFQHEREMAFPVSEEDRPLYHPLRYRG